MLWRQFVSIALLLLVSASHAEKQDDSVEDGDDSFYDSRGESGSAYHANSRDGRKRLLWSFLV